MAVELGLDGTEIYEPFLGDLDASGMARLSDVVQDAGLLVSQVAIESHFCNPEQRVAEIAHVKRAVDTAVIFRTDTVRVVSGRGSEGLNHEDVLQSVAVGLKGIRHHRHPGQCRGHVSPVVAFIELNGEARNPVHRRTGY